MLDSFFEFRPTFPIAGQLLPKRSGNCQFPSDFGKSCPEIVISVRLSPKRSDTLRGIARRSGLGSFFEITRIRGSFGRYIGGAVYDLAGSYNPALVGAAIALVLAVVLVYRLGPYVFPVQARFGPELTPQPAVS